MTAPALLTLDQIVQAGLCIGCGLCESLAGRDRVRIVMTPEGRERPAVQAPLDDARLADQRRLSGLKVEGRTRQGARKARWDAVWGPATGS
jgi:coenzyme F420 hydrogenase subunit beta